VGCGNQQSRTDVQNVDAAVGQAESSESNGEGVAGKAAEGEESEVVEEAETAKETEVIAL